ncbi:MAG: PD40 domain-containing protein [Chloroflexi bacterium]|nr:PD40 domain-containing protein [Chloroflexota bacterium]
MNQKLFTFIEVVVLGGLVVFVMYIGGAFKAPDAVPTPQPAPTQLAPTATLNITPVPSVTPAPPALTQPIGLIAFDSFRDGNPEIYVVDVETGIQTNLTNNPESDGLIAWSPDGSRLAFTSDRSGEPEIYVMNADGAEVIQLTHTQDTQDTKTGYYPFVSWSPDGRQIVIVRHEARPGQRYVLSSLDLIRSDGSGVKTLYSSTEFYILQASWSPDGKYIAVTGSDSSSSALRVHVGEVGEAPFGLNYFQGNPCDKYIWSPDSKITCFGDRESVTMNPDGSEAKTRPTGLSGDGFVEGVAWSPDGQHLLFLATMFIPQSDQNPTRRLFAINANGSENLKIIDVRESETAFNIIPSWSPDGQWIAYSLVKGDLADIYIVNIYEPSQYRQLTSDTSYNFSPQWQPRPKQMP